MTRPFRDSGPRPAHVRQSSHAIQSRCERRALDLLLLVATLFVLATCGGSRQDADDSASTRDGASTQGASNAAGTERGAELYARCATCHQQNGEGVPGGFPPLAGSEWVTRNATIPIRIVLHGLQGPIMVKGQAFDAAMLSYGTGAPMSDAEVAAVVTYIRNSWGNTASEVTAEQVAQERAATRTRTTPWTAAELQSIR